MRENPVFLRVLRKSAKGKTAEKIGKPINEILFLDDNYDADKTAILSGIKVCGIYDASSEDYTNDIKGVSDYYIYNFSEILELKK